MRKLIAGIGVALLALVSIGPAAANVSTTTALAAVEPAPAYGACGNKSTGLLRILERNNLASSKDGKCRDTERKITLPSIAGGPNKLVFKRGLATETCTRATRTFSATWTFTCTTVTVPAPSPSPTPTPSPTATP
uniref:hypothetical protein n=1 Tax=Herbidospora sakaeratensis TaxID=564415 RepID=UPI0007809C0E|nr:hypothetical protein [Herbidospora sakaeratensis]